MRENILKNQKGVTLLALVTVIMVLMILAAVSISTLVSDHGAVEEATNAAIQAEVARVAEVTDVYLRDKETQRLKRRDYSSPTTQEDLADIITPVETQEKISLGIYRNFVELEFSSDYGAGGSSVDKNWSGNMTDLEDCFAIDLKTNEVYYIDKGDIWKRSGKTTTDDVTKQNQEFAAKTSSATQITTNRGKTSSNVVDSLENIKPIITVKNINSSTKNTIVKISYPEIDGLKKQVSTDGGKTYKEYTGAITVTSLDETIYAKSILGNDVRMATVTIDE